MQDETYLKLSQLRSYIDGLDDQIVRLLVWRLAAVKQVGHLKEQTQVGEDRIQFYQPAREQAIYNRLSHAAERLTLSELLVEDPSQLAFDVERELNAFLQAHEAKDQLQGPLLTREGIEQIYQEIISYSISQEQRQTMAYLGPAGTFSHQAAMQMFGSSARALACNTIGQVVHAVEDGDTMYGVIPFENTVSGIVGISFDMLVQATGLHIVRETRVSVQHCLAGRADLDWTQIDWRSVSRIYSHPQSFMQCQHWLDKYVPHAHCEPVDSNARAAELIASEEDTDALQLCIAPVPAAKQYGLHILLSSIQDVRNNQTRFICLGQHEVPPLGSMALELYRTALLVSAPDRPGALGKILQIFQDNRINLTALHSRPNTSNTSRQWSFYLEAEGHKSQPHWQQALEQLEEQCFLTRIFGSYPPDDSSPPEGAK
ncbi:MAG: prephenate dehydratase [Gammaproteobacteria bacterium]